MPSAMAAAAPAAAGGAEPATAAPAGAQLGDVPATAAHGSESPAAAARAPATFRKIIGKGSNFSHDEDIALCEGYAKCTFNSLKGANQKLTVFSAHLRREFLRNPRCPFATMEEQLAASLDDHKMATRWHARTDQYLSRRAHDIRKLLTKFHSKYKMILGMELTGGLDEEGLLNAATFAFHGGVLLRSELYKAATGGTEIKPKFKYIPSIYIHVRIHPFCASSMPARYPLREQAQMATSCLRERTIVTTILLVHPVAPSLRKWKTQRVRKARGLRERSTKSAARGAKKGSTESTASLNGIEKLVSSAIEVIKEPVVVSAGSGGGDGNLPAMGSLSPKSCLEYYKTLMLATADQTGIEEPALKKQRAETCSAMHSLFLSSMASLHGGNMGASPAGAAPAAGGGGPRAAARCASADADSHGRLPSVSVTQTESLPPPAVELPHSTY